MVIRIFAALLALVFLSAAAATIIAPTLWEHYGILLTTPRAINQFVSVVGGTGFALGLICLFVTATGQDRLNVIFAVGVLLATIALLRPVALILYGGWGWKIGVEWLLETFAAILSLWLASKRENKLGKTKRR